MLRARAGSALGEGRDGERPWAVRGARSCLSRPPGGLVVTARVHSCRASALELDARRTSTSGRYAGAAQSLHSRCRPSRREARARRTLVVDNGSGRGHPPAQAPQRPGGPAAAHACLDQL
ncbi:hypothetical protein SVAN01_10818 [Stagonosporopsis vannaccii]|nr:hypothetical protein SVAN01_10818 [Stagonosporopsis vannaccii]